jgi:uncharacterized protein (UPF0262 family)
MGAGHPARLVDRAALSPPDPRIIAIELDEHTILWRNADVEQERRVAIFDLLEANHFAPLGQFENHTGPWHVRLRLEEGRLAIELGASKGETLGTVLLPLAPFRRTVREYFAICESYYSAIRTATAAQIETIDMARRGIHNDAAETLIDRLADKVEIDFDTARRLFTLICVLHIRG